MTEITSVKSSLTVTNVNLKPDILEAWSPWQSQVLFYGSSVDSVIDASGHIVL